MTQSSTLEEQHQNYIRQCNDGLIEILDKKAHIKAGLGRKNEHNIFFYDNFLNFIIFEFN